MARALLCFAVCSDVRADTVASVAGLVDLSLEQLNNIVVTSISRREQSLADAPASIYVITSDANRRSGATSLPEALRLAPNLQVARANANQYAITARGFNNVLANKLLVMIDGHAIYTPLFSGTFWEAQDVLLEDIDRIEVVSGPGATLWGANAVNGMIPMSGVDHPLPLRGDATRLVQVVSHLLHNAAKFTPPGGNIAIAVTDHAATVDVVVSDNGVGIAPDTAARIFNLSEQADQTVEGAQQGLGVGLTLARRIVMLHGATLEVQSQGLGLGAEFKVVLPRAPGAP